MRSTFLEPRQYVGLSHMRYVNGIYTSGQGFSLSGYGVTFIIDVEGIVGSIKATTSMDAAYNLLGIKNGTITQITSAPSRVSSMPSTSFNNYDLLYLCFAIDKTPTITVTITEN